MFYKTHAGYSIHYHTKVKGYLKHFIAVSHVDSIMIPLLLSVCCSHLVWTHFTLLVCVIAGRNLQSSFSLPAPAIRPFNWRDLNEGITSISCCQENAGRANLFNGVRVECWQEPTLWVRRHPTFEQESADMNCLSVSRREMAHAL